MPYEWLKDAAKRSADETRVRKAKANEASECVCTDDHSHCKHARCCHCGCPARPRPV